MPLQKWRKKSEHCRKIYTFADCFARENAGLLRSARNDAKRQKRGKKLFFHFFLVRIEKSCTFAPRNEAG